MSFANQALDLRNACGHPSKYAAGEKKVSAFIEDVIGIARKWGLQWSSGEPLGRGSARHSGEWMTKGRPSPTATNKEAPMPAKFTPKLTRPETVRKGHKWCPRCGEVKKHADFARNRAKDILYSIRKSCERADRIAAKERRAAAAAEAETAVKPKRSRKAASA